MWYLKVWLLSCRGNPAISQKRNETKCIWGKIRAAIFAFEWEDNVTILFYVGAACLRYIQYETYSAAALPRSKEKSSPLSQVALQHFRWVYSELCQITTLWQPLAAAHCPRIRAWLLYKCQDPTLPPSTRIPPKTPSATLPSPQNTFLPSAPCKT